MPRELKTARSVDQVGVSFDRVAVIGEPELCYQHIRAWKLSGIGAKKVSPREAVSSSNKEIRLDICVSDFSEREILIENLIRSGSSVIVTGPISDRYEVAQRILNKSNIENGKLITIDLMKNHPLVARTRSLITEGQIGKPRILKLEILTYDKQLSEFSNFSGLFNGISMMDLFFSHSKPAKIFAKVVKTEYSCFYVAVVTLQNGASCQLIAGASSKSGKTEFSINGEGGMISFNESKTLETPLGVNYSDAMIALSSLDSLAKSFTEFVQNGAGYQLDSLERYRVAEVIQESAKKGKPITY
jgi:predicted dehydrogenase